MQKMKEALSRRQGIVLLLALVAALVVPGGSKPGPAPARDDLNVLLISIDTIRPDRLGCYGSKHLKTPSIDALAAKGVVFERAFAHTPMTLPSHANILTGATPLFHGVHENSKSVLSKDFLTLAEYLKDKGYSTGAFIGSFVLDSRFGLGQGFDIYDESYPSKSSALFSYPERKAGQVVQAARSWLEKQTSKWFLFLHLWDPHAPYRPPQPFQDQFKADPYSGEVAYVDHELGALFDDLERKELLKKTVIVLTGDHGESLAEHGELTHGYFAYNSTLWVPFIIVAPGISAVRVDEYVCHIDIFPTVCDLLTFEKPSFLQGISLVPLLKGRGMGKRSIYFESLDAYCNRGWAPLRGFIEGPWKFIDSPLPESYHLGDDFNEQNNLVRKTDLERQKKKMKDLLDRLSSSHTIQNPPRFDRETREKLESLGYVSSPYAKPKESYGPADDLKTLLSLHEKNYAALRLYEEGRIAEAVKLFHDLIKERPDFSSVYVFLSDIYKSQGLSDEAEGILARGYHDNPDDYGIISAYGRRLVEDGKLETGIEFLQKALTIIDEDPEVWTNLGIAHSQKGEYQKALGDYEKALSLDANDAAIYNNLGLLYISLFAKTGAGRDHARALECYQKAIELDPTLASAHNGLGRAYAASGQIDKAISAWEKALELKPDFDFPIYNLGLAYFDKGDRAQALKYFEKYLLLWGKKLTPEERREIEDLIKKCRNEVQALTGQESPATE